MLMLAAAFLAVRLLVGTGLLFVQAVSDPTSFREPEIHFDDKFIPNDLANIPLGIPESVRSKLGSTARKAQ